MAARKLSCVLAKQYIKIRSSCFIFCQHFLVQMLGMEHCTGRIMIMQSQIKGTSLSTRRGSPALSTENVLSHIVLKAKLDLPFISLRWQPALWCESCKDTSLQQGGHEHTQSRKTTIQSITRRAKTLEMTATRWVVTVSCQSRRVADRSMKMDVRPTWMQLSRPARSVGV